MGYWGTIGEMVKDLSCRHCSRNDMLEPDPGAYYTDAINEHGRGEPFLCHCAASYKAHGEEQPDYWQRYEKHRPATS